MSIPFLRPWVPDKAKASPSFIPTGRIAKRPVWRGLLLGEEDSGGPHWAGGGRRFSRSGRWSVGGEVWSRRGKRLRGGGGSMRARETQKGRGEDVQKGEGPSEGSGARGPAEATRTGEGTGRQPGTDRPPAPSSSPPPPSSAGSWRSASERALSATRRRCARCCRCARAAARALRPRPQLPRRTRQPPREPCSAWCRGRPGRPTGRCPCWRASSRLSLASRGVCPGKAASEDPSSPWRPSS